MLISDREPSSKIMLDSHGEGGTIALGASPDKAPQGRLPLSIAMRAYAQRDADTCVQLGARMHAESKYAHLPYDADAVYKLLNHIDGNYLAGYVAEHVADGIIGFIAMQISPYIFTQGLVASDLAVYVTPEHRNTIAFAGLIRAGERWAKRQGATSIVMGITAPTDVERIARVYRKMGYDNFGVVMRKEI